jgi:hypothetical protein
MNLRRMVYGCLAMALSAGMAMAQESKTGSDQDKGKEKGAGKEADPQAMMAAYEKAAAPGEQHRLLQKQVGKWDVSMKSWPAPNAPAMESTGTAETKSILGDRYIQMSLNSTFMGKPFSGIATTGYDNAKKKFVGTWIDSMSTGLMLSEATADPSGKLFTARAVATDPLTRKETKMRIVTKWETDDKFVDEFYEKKGGKEVKTMEVTYTRAK